MSRLAKKPTLAQLQKQVSELTGALQRERADAENLRKRHENELRWGAQFHKIQIIRELVPALDNLERALAHVPKDLKGHDYVKGIQSVAKQFEDCFKKLGVERIKTVGEVFDPKLHEAISVEDAGGSSPAGEEIVCEELQPGYKLGDEIIRHALVKVKMEKK